MGEKSRPVIGKLMEALCYAGNDGFSSDSVTSPRSPLDLMILSPRGLVKCDLGGIGLGIVAAMDNGGAIAKAAFGGMSRTVDGFEDDDDDDDDDEDYTCVISHAGPNKTFSRRMYFHDDFKKRGQGQNNDSNKHVPSCTFYICQDGILDDLAAAAPVSDSDLSSCGLCRKGLQGKDVYIYRGERGYCSEECRESHIAMEVCED